MSSPASKNVRDEIAIAEAIRQLEASVSAEAEAKLSALEDLEDLIDPLDEGYEVQRQAAADGVLNVLMQLLEDDSEAVAAAAASTFAALASHSAMVKGRAASSTLSGPEKMALNPVHDLLPELEGLISVLVNHKFSGQPALAESADAALAAATSLNYEISRQLLTEVVQRLQRGEPAALEALDSIISGPLEVRDEVAVLLDQALTPVLASLRTGEGAQKLDAVTLLGSLLERRPGAAAYVVSEGGLEPLAQLLASGTLEEADAATHALWLLVQGNRRLLSPLKAALGVPGASLVAPLLAVIKADAEAQRREDAKALESSEEEEEEEEAAAEGGEAAGAAEEEEEEEVAVDHSDDAALLLKALAAADPDAAAALRGVGGSDEIVDRAASCSIM